MLGYLIGGAVIGPFALGWVGGTQGEEAMHFAEFGVVIMLFMIGLELEPARLWRMRGPIFGLGGLQVSCTALAVAAAAMAFGLDAKPALAAGMILALSSTAIVIQTLQEKALLRSDAGSDTFCRAAVSRHLCHPDVGDVSPTRQRYGLGRESWLAARAAARHTRRSGGHRDRRAVCGVAWLCDSRENRPAGTADGCRLAADCAKGQFLYPGY